MVIPGSFASYERKIEFFVQSRNRYVKAIDFFGDTVAVGDSIDGWREKFCPVFLSVFGKSGLKIRNIFGRQGNMYGHCSVFNSEGSFSVTGLAYMEHAAVCAEISGVNAVLQDRP